MKTNIPDTLIQAIGISRSMCISTSVDCSVVDHNSDIVSVNGQFHGSFFCCRNKPSVAGRCNDVHSFGLHQSLINGETYIYQCRCSLLFLIAPILHNGLLAGGLLSGPALLPESRDLFFSSAPEKGEISSISQITSEKARAIAQMLLYSANYLSTEDVKSPKERSLPENAEKLLQYYQKNGEINSEYPLNEEKQLIQYIKLGDTNSARKLLNEILGKIYFSYEKNFECLKVRILELIVLLSRATIEAGVPTGEVFGMNLHYLKEIDHYTSFEGINGWFNRIIVNFSRLVLSENNIKHERVILNAVKYINENYHKKISLEDLSNAVYMSPPYLSKIFKEEMKCSFNTYLNNVRIEKSKYLLLHTNDLLVDIALATGFDNQSYFTKVFKKNVGISPAKFRESRGLFPK